MKIGFISDDYHPRVDGVVVYLDAMSQELKKLGHDVYIICPKYPGHTNSEGNVIRVSSYDPLPLSKLTSRMIITNKKTLKTIEELDLDIIHSHTQSGSNFAAFVAAKKFHKPLVTTMHTTYHPLIEAYPGTAFVSAVASNFLAWRYYRDYRALRALIVIKFPIKSYVEMLLMSYIRSVLDNSDLVITNSNHTKKYVNEFGSKNETLIVRNGIDRNLFKAVSKNEKTPSSFRFVLTSRVSSEKRQEVAIRAVARLVADGYDCHLTLIGGGPNRHKCEKLINSLGVESSVVITGEVEREQVKELLDEADAGLFTSYHFDTDPLAVMEYLAMGLPVIYCDENFDHMFLAGAAKKCKTDHNSFAAAMKKIMSDKEKLKTMSGFARQSSEKHDILDRAKELEKVYFDVIEAQ